MSNQEKIITGSKAINDALAFIGKSNKNALLFAEGVNDPSAIFGTQKNLLEVYGKERLIEMPVSENALCGVAIGAAMNGKRPIISFHRVEFALLAMEQIINNAAKMHYVSNGQHACPLVIRLVVGRGWGQGPEHSQSLETMFSYIPGLKVLMPTFPDDYKNAMITSVADNNPTIIIEHRWTHYVKGKVIQKEIGSDVSQPRKIFSGNDFTIVSTSYSTLEAMKAHNTLKKFDINIELFDLRTLRPLKLESIFESIKKTGHLLTVDTGYKTLGIGSEITSQVTEKCFDYLKTAPKRIGLPDHPTPSSRGYIDGYYPDSLKIIKTIIENLDLSQEKKSEIFDDFNNNKKELPIDIPDPAFQGPF